MHSQTQIRKSKIRSPGGLRRRIEGAGCDDQQDWYVCISEILFSEIGANGVQPNGIWGCGVGTRRTFYEEM